MKKTDYITSVLKRLHRLPANDRITFTLLLLTYKSLNELAPMYINELFHYYTSRRFLRSRDSNFLVTPQTITVTYGDRSFAAIAPKLWISYRLAIRQSNSVSASRHLSVECVFKNAFYRSL